MTTRNRAAAAISAGWIVFVAPVMAAIAASHETVVPVPRHHREPVDLTCGPVILRSVAIDSPPSDRELSKARRDPDDTSRLHWKFFVGNAGRKKWDVRITVTVLSADDRVLAEDSRKDSIGSRTSRDHISVWTRIRTTDYASADHLRVSVSCEKD